MSNSVGQPRGGGGGVYRGSSEPRPRDCSDLKRQFEEIVERQAELWRRDGDLLQAVTQAKNKVDNLSREINTLTQINDRRIEELRWWEGYIKSIEAQSTRHSNQIASSSDEITKCQKERAGLVRSLSARTDEAERQQVAKKISDLDAKIANFEVVISRAKEKKASADEIVTFHRSQLQQFSNEIHALEQKRQQLTEDLEFAKRELQIAKDRARKTRDELDKLIEEGKAKAKEYYQCEKANP